MLWIKSRDTCGPPAPSLLKILERLEKGVCDSSGDAVLGLKNLFGWKKPSINLWSLRR